MPRSLAWSESQLKKKKKDPLKIYFQKLHPVGAGEDIAFKCIQVL